MGPQQAVDGSELEFFGVKLKVNNPRLAALLNSDVTEDVQVIGRRARDAFSPGDDAGEEVTAPPVLHADDSVVIRLEETEET